MLSSQIIYLLREMSQLKSISLVCEKKENKKKRNSYILTLFLDRITGAIHCKAGCIFGLITLWNTWLLAIAGW